ncbi:phosphotransferase, partial [Acidiphilium sp.]|uniref:phosphotransferase n=1 Tax=Acidiphilium sp. TaxID=527 RepID=UPI003CFF3A93
MTIPAEQAEVAAFLTALTGAPPIETHISAVFLGGDRAWKLKKAVRLPYLDFSAIATRHRMVAREFALNRRTAPAIYRAIHAVRRLPNGGLTLAEASADTAPVVDWVLEMARIPQSAFFDAMAAAHALSDAVLDDLADAVFNFHAALAPPAPPEFPALRDWPTVIDRIIADNVAAAGVTSLPVQGIAAWHDAARAQSRARRRWLAGRAAEGRIRHAHGDLHLGNICLWQGRPTLIDALEFDDALATIDLGYDIAFLLMDLAYRAGRTAANRVLNRYVARTGDAGLAPGLALYMSLRAMIRAHVGAHVGAQTAAPQAHAQLDA